MTSISIRKKLHNYIADISDNKVKGMYLLLKDEIEKKEDFQLTPRHLEILEDEKNKHLQGESKSYNRKQARKFISGNKKKS